MEFKPYESKPVTRMAIQLTDEHEWVDMGNSTYMLAPKNEDNNTVAMLKFKAYQEPVVGDWVLRLTDEDTYHCTDAVFRERNIVPE